MFATLTSEERMTLPRELRNRLNLEPNRSSTAGQAGGPMIGVDASALLRRWLDDDPPQIKRVDQWLTEHGGLPGSLLVTDVALVEVTSTLKSALQQDEHAQSIAVRSVPGETAFAFGDREAVVAARALFESCCCTFADCLIVARQARRDRDFAATFDRGMRMLSGLEVL